MGRRVVARLALLVAVWTSAACGGEKAPEPAAEPFMVRPPLAGVSANVDFTVDSIRPGDFGADTTGPLWSRFNHRCSGCHVAPSPKQHPAGRWAEVVDRMGGHFEDAGLLPFSEAEADTIAAFLDRHAPGE